MKRLIWITLVALLTGPAWSDVNLPTDPNKEGTGNVIDLIDPIKHLLSGRPWLLAEGLDPGLMKRPGWNTLTRHNWSQVQGAFANPSPSTQAAGGFLVPFRSPAPAFSRDLLISRDFSNIPIQTEPHIAVHPDDPDHAVVAMIDYNFPSVSSYVTIDGGESWEGPYQGGYLPDDMISGGDPVLDFDSDGNLYMTTISIGVEEFSIGPVFTSSLVSSIAVARSDDGGYSWPNIISTARSSVKLSEQQIDPSGRLRGTVSIGFLDKPWIVVGRDPEDPSKELIYVVYIEFEVFYQIIYTGELPLLLPREMASTVRLVKSDDRGVTWSDPLGVSPTVRRVYGEVSSAAPGVFGSDRVVQGPRPAVDREGNLYIAWLDSTDDGSMEGLGELYFSRSDDAGKTFTTPRVISVFNEVPFRPRSAFFRYWASAFPKMAVGPGGELYVVYTGRPSEKPMDDGDIFFIRSIDGGEDWSSPVRLNDDDGSSLQFFPEIDVSPDGTINVMWADMRDDPTQIRYHIYFTESDDRGYTWGFESAEFGLRTRDTRVTDFPTNPNRAFTYGLFIGDYFGMAATDGDVYMVWADARLAEYGGINQKIGFARKRAIRKPDVFVSPSAGPGGQSITIQGFNFQPDMMVMVQLQDATIATARTNQEGRFTTGIYVPVTGEGPQTLRVFDETGNMASTSFYTEFGFDNIQEIYEELLFEIQDLSRRSEE